MTNKILMIILAILLALALMFLLSGRKGSRSGANSKSSYPMQKLDSEIDSYESAGENAIKREAKDTAGYTTPAPEAPVDDKEEDRDLGAGADGEKLKQPK